LKIYLDGVEGTYATQTQGVGPVIEYGQDYLIGGLTTGSSDFNGSIDEVMIFNTALNSTQITAIYNNQSQRYKSSGNAILKQVRTNNTKNDRLLLNMTTKTEFNTTIDARIGRWGVDDGYNVSDNSLVGYWNFNGNTSDISGLGNDGTLYGGVSNGTGVYNGSYEFDGENDYIIVSDINSIDLYANQDMSYSGWFKTNDSTGTSVRTIYDKRVYGAPLRGIAIGLENTGKFWAKTYYATTTTTSSTVTAYDDGKWHHFVVVLDRDASQKAYIDGALADSDDMSANDNNDLSNNAAVTIGKKSYSASTVLPWRGSLDEIMIFNRTLSADEVEELYVKGRANWNYTDYQNVSEEFEISASHTNFLPDVRLFSASSSDYSFYSPLMLSSSFTLDLSVSGSLNGSFEDILWNRTSLLLENSSIDNTLIFNNTGATAENISLYNITNALLYSPSTLSIYLNSTISENTGNFFNITIDAGDSIYILNHFNVSESFPRTTSPISFVNSIDTVKYIKTELSELIIADIVSSVGHCDVYQVYYTPNMTIRHQITNFTCTDNQLFTSTQQIKVSSNILEIAYNNVDLGGGGGGGSWSYVPPVTENITAELNETNVTMIAPSAVKDIVEDNKLMIYFSFVLIIILIIVVLIYL